MTERLVHVTDGLFSIRGDFRIAGLLNVGTQATLVRASDGHFVLLDSYRLEGDILRQVMDLTDDGRRLTALVQLHPYHTSFVRDVVRLFPHAALYGTARHHRLLSDLRWEPTKSEDPAMNERLGPDWQFIVPDGVSFIPQSDRHHFSSVLALHHPTRSLVVDDTLTWMPWPWSRLDFHPSLSGVLEPRAAAATEFRSWAHRLIELSTDLDYVLTAHTRLPTADPQPAGAISAAVSRALSRVESTLRRHERKFG